jgi:hypothetical protein
MLPTNLGSFETDELDELTEEELEELELIELLELDPGVGPGTPQAASEVTNTAE